MCFSILLLLFENIFEKNIYELFDVIGSCLECGFRLNWYSFLVELGISFGGILKYGVWLGSM